MQIHFKFFWIFTFPFVCLHHNNIERYAGTRFLRQRTVGCFKKEIKFKCKTMIFLNKIYFCKGCNCKINSKQGKLFKKCFFAKKSHGSRNILLVEVLEYIPAGIVVEVKGVGIGPVVDLLPLGKVLSQRRPQRRAEFHLKKKKQMTQNDSLFIGLILRRLQLQPKKIIFAFSLSFSETSTPGMQSSIKIIYF